MRNLKPYTDDAFAFYKKVIDNKNTTGKDPNFKTRLAYLDKSVEDCFKKYDTAFNTDSLQNLVSANYTGQEQKDLLALYSYHSSIIQKLKIDVTTTELNRIINSCQNCTIGEVNSFDHIIPQQEFSEFVVHPKNLFPSCSKCNGHKSKVWRESGSRLFLNLYLDQLPDLQYLFVSVKITGKDIETDFSIRNSAVIDAALFMKISYHYEKLQLCRRFSDNNDLVITPLKNLIAENAKKLDKKDIIETAIGVAQRNQKAFGFNYWQSILQLALLQSDDFFNLCTQEA